MDRLSACLAGRVENTVLTEIAVSRHGWSDMYRLVGLAHKGHGGVCVGIYGDCADAESACGADDAAGDFSAIGDQQAFNHRHPPHILNRPNCARSGIGAFSTAEKASPSTSRVWAGSITPSSQSLAVA
ncbi:hypothetical protein D3C80_1454200 [compost metagenome]